MRPLVVALVPGQQRSLDKLKATRVQLSNEVADLISDFGPKLYEDFNEVRRGVESHRHLYQIAWGFFFQWRILVPSASVPPSSGTPGLWRRKSGTGAVDAQGLGLTHPMTWIDERLFGWSRSAKRGTSAWEGIADDGSRVGSPDDTDDEDTGDYDDVVGLIPGAEDQFNSAHKSRSRQSSYADLQRLRLSPLQHVSATSSEPLPAESSEGLHFRQNHRTRRESLSDGVPVLRIAAASRQEPFVDVTHGLNDEIRRIKSGQGQVV